MIQVKNKIFNNLFRMVQTVPLNINLKGTTITAMIVQFFGSTLFVQSFQKLAAWGHIVFVMGMSRCSPGPPDPFGPLGMWSAGHSVNRPCLVRQADWICSSFASHCGLFALPCSCFVCLYSHVACLCSYRCRWERLFDWTFFTNVQDVRRSHLEGLEACPILRYVAN